MSERDWTSDGTISELLLASSRDAGGWVHDRCELCLAPFDAEARARRLRGGHVAPGERDRWVCGECFDDFRSLFSWSVVGATPLH